jgi:hypothetical protein
MEAVVLFTGYALLAIVAVLGALAAHRAADRAQHEANALRVARGRVIALEHAVEALDEKWRRLNGRVSKAQDRPAEPPAAPETPEQTRARLRAEHGLPRVGAEH